MTYILFCNKLVSVRYKMNKKKIVITAILALLGLSLILTSLFVPIVHVVGKDVAKSVVYDENVNLIKYVFDSPFWTTDASEVYFNATGPIWTATGSILSSVFVAVCGFVLLFIAVLEVLTLKKENINFKSNNLLKKIALFVGYFVIIIGIFSIVSFIVTTILSEGMVEFNLNIAPCAYVIVGITIIVLAHTVTNKNDQIQYCKMKNSIGFALTAICSLLAFVLIFIPQYTQYYYSPTVRSFWALSKEATNISSESYIFNTMGDYPIGFTSWFVIMLGFTTAFVFIYGIIGFIFSLCGKKANWPSSRIKRWSMVYLIVYSIIYFLVFCSAGVLVSSLKIDDIYVFKPIAYIFMFTPFLPYIFSTMISREKKYKNEN